MSHLSTLILSCILSPPCPPWLCAASAAGLSLTRHASVIRSACCLVLALHALPPVLCCACHRRACCTLCTLYSLHCAVAICTLYWCPLYSVPCTLRALCTLYSVLLSPVRCPPYSHALYSVLCTQRSSVLHGVLCTHSVTTFIFITPEVQAAFVFNCCRVTYHITVCSLVVFPTIFFFLLIIVSYLKRFDAHNVRC